MTIVGRPLADISLGDIVEDGITSLKGVAIGISHWLSQCDQVCVKPQGLHDGKPHEAVWIDITHLTVVTAGAFAHMAPAVNEIKTGGPATERMPAR